MKAEPEIRQFISLPTDPALIAQLRTKLEEYKVRIIGKGRYWEFAHPTFAHTYDGFRDAHYKACVLKAVLDEINSGAKQLDTWKLSRDLVTRLGTVFNAKDFNNACGVVACYCGDIPTEELEGGTGLPEIK